jgi:hypothetical protein|tara:strand:+ start:598 stop:885 length:288 start_codon:yes stop_codon:yes gene_type:complete
MKKRIKMAANFSNVLKAELQSSNRIFGGTYIKKDGSVTKFNGRMGVHKFTKGGKSSIKDSNWLIWDNNRKRYMQIIPENIESISAFGMEFEFLNK